MRGFSILEVLISALIVSFIIGGIYMVLEIGNSTFLTDIGLLDLQQQARKAMDGMAREIRQNGSSYNLAISAGSAEITFSIPDISNIRYYLDTNVQRIIREQPAGSGSTKILADNINSLSFCCCSDVNCSSCDALCSNPHVVKIQLTANKTVMLRPLSFSLTEKVRLRNE